MKKIQFICLLFFLVFSVTQAWSQRTRLIILADMGNEPDEEQQMTHLLMCSNEFDLEGLIAVTGKYLQPASSDPYKQVVHPELFHQIIDAYDRVYENLKIHAGGWPEPGYLRSIVASGQPGYGIDDVGEDMSTEGSDLILKSLMKDDPRPVYIVVNAGSNTLAQALIDIRANHTEREMKKIIEKIRVYENGAQDNAGAWICANFPDIHWIRSNYQTYAYAGPSWEGEADGTGKLANLGPNTWEPYEYNAIGQHQWALEHIKGQHGPMGFRWPVRQFHDGRITFLEGGGTVPWLCLLNMGLTDIDRPWWGGWSGRFTEEKVENVMSKHESVRVDEENFKPFRTYTEVAEKWIDPETGVEYESIFSPVWRWRRDFFNDFKCRMDWCIMDFDEANHHPIAAINGDRTEKIHRLKVKRGEQLELDASASTDPDGDGLLFDWWIYNEAGSYEGTPVIEGAQRPVVKFTVPNDAAGKQIHLILTLRDVNKIGSLYDYRRIVMDVE